MEREQDVLTTSEPFDPVMAVYDGALAIKDVAAGLEEDRPRRGRYAAHGRMAFENGGGAV